MLGGGTMEEKNPVKSADRIFRVMELLSEEGSMGVTEIGQRLDLNKSTVHRLLMSLVSMKYVKKDQENDRYSMTYKIVRLANSIREKSDTVSIVHPLLRELSMKCGETVHFVQQNDNEIVYIDKVESNVNSVRMVSKIGLTHSIFTTGVGKAILAELPEYQVKEMWKRSSFEALTQYTITEFDEYMAELRRTKERGYGLDNEENEIGVRCVAACVYNYKGKAEHAISISVPITRMGDERVEELSKYLLEYKERVSQALGGVRDE